MSAKSVRKVFENGKGILQLTPTWVPRGFNEPGHRLRLHPDDYYALGMDRGGICERWLGSVTIALNGPKTGPTEGMSFVLADRKTGEKILFADAVKELGAELIGDTLQKKYGTWPTFAKLYDYDKPLFHHLHLKEEMATKIGRHGKPEAYYFPRQYNAYMGRFPLTYFGFDPSVTPEQVKDCIRNYDKFDTRITELSRAYRIQLGTGWYTPAGVIHAPRRSVVTYEPQWNSDVNTIMENVTMGEVNPHNLLTDCQPDSEKDDIEALFKTDRLEGKHPSQLQGKIFPHAKRPGRGQERPRREMGRVRERMGRREGSHRRARSRGHTDRSDLLLRARRPGTRQVRRIRVRSAGASPHRPAFRRRVLRLRGCGEERLHHQERQ